MKQKREIGVLVVLLLIAGGIWFSYFRTDRVAATFETASTAQNYHVFTVDNPQIRIDEIDKARKAEYKSSGRNIFSVVAPPPQTVRHHDADPTPVFPATPCGVAVGPCQPAPPPPPPPLKLPPNMKFFGYGTGPNSTIRRAFFTDGEEVYIVNEGQLLLNRFLILKVGNASVEFEETSSGRRGTAPLEEQAGPPA